MIREFNPQTDDLTIFKAFEKESKFLDIDPEYAKQRYEEMIKSGSAAMLILEEKGESVGGLGLINASGIHNRHRIAVEDFWWVDPNHRGKGLDLFFAFEAWAKIHGCQQTAMVHLVDSMPERLERFYLRQGYHLVEKHYVKEI